MPGRTPRSSACPSAIPAGTTSKTSTNYRTTSRRRSNTSSTSTSSSSPASSRTHAATKASMRLGKRSGSARSAAPQPTPREGSGGAGVGQESCADGTRLLAELGDHDRHGRTVIGREDQFQVRGAGGLHQELARPGEPTPQHDDLRVEDVDDVGDPEGHPPRESGDHLQGLLVALTGGRRDVLPL